jgi:DNA-binding beta-propeller fold protein YncE
MTQSSKTSLLTWAGIAGVSVMTLAIAPSAEAITLTYDSSIGRAANLAEGEPLGTPGTLAVPQGITVQQSTDTVFVSNGRFIDRVEKFDSAGTYLGGIGGTGTGPGQFDEPSALEFSPLTGNLYVGDVFNNRVNVYDGQGAFIKSFAEGTFGELKPGRAFFGPSGVTFDKTGNVYVGDFSNDRIIKFTPDGEQIGELGTSGTEAGQFQGPAGVRISPNSGNIYVSDQFNNRVQVLDPEGKPLLSFGSQGTEPGQFNQPIGIEVDEYENIYVADSINSRVQVFDKSGNFLTAYGEPALTATGERVPPPALTDPPYGTTLDLRPGVFNWTGGTSYVDGKLYVGDFFQGRVQVLNVSNNAPQGAEPVPEPSTIAASLLMGAGFIGGKLRKRSQKVAS